MNVQPYANNATLFLRISVGGGSFEQLERGGFGSDDVLGKGIVVIGEEGTRGVDGKARAWEEELRRRWAEGVAESGGGEEGGGGGGGGGGSTDGRHGSW